MKLTLSEKLKLKRFIMELSSHKATHTEFVTVYVPQGYDLTKIIQHLAQEQGTASNIKSASTRKNVQASLERMIQHLRGIEKTPPNGLAAFAGNVAAKEGKQDLQVRSIEPPLPLKTRIYRCDKFFVTDILEEMIMEKEVYGLVVLDRRDANLALLRGKTIIPLKKTHSEVPGKTRAGGQCHVFGTMIQSATGSIPKIENSHNPYVLKSMVMDNYSIKDSPITDKWQTKKHEVYKIKTKYPQLIVESSKDHLFLVHTDEGIVDKAAEELKEGDTLLMPERINIKGKTQRFNPQKYHNSFIINDEGKNILKQKRVEQGLLQREFAKKIGLKQTTISFIEIGKRNPRKETIKNICGELHLNCNEFLKKYTKPTHYRNTKIFLPYELNEDFAQFLGYFMGDGCMEQDRVTFFEQRKEVAMMYKTICDGFLNIQSSYRFRTSKNYHQLRFTSRPLVKLIKGEFPELKKTWDSEIPVKILESKNEVVAKFLKGFFDAEGYVVRDSVGIASVNKTIILQTLLLLLRFSILASFQEYDNKKNPYSNNPIFKLQINEKESLLNFQKFIGLTSFEKRKKLQKLINNKSDKSSVRQILLSGKQIRKIIEKAGYNINLFPQVSNFFRNERMMGKPTFKNSILDRVKDKKLHQQLEKIYNYQILPVKISKIEKTKKTTEMIDISVKNQNFIANGLIVHNSSQRFARIREGAYKDHFKKIAEFMKEQFLPLGNDLKGIIIGGPGTTIASFMEKDYLTGDIKKKIIGNKDLSYTGDFGLQELLDKSEDLLAQEEVTHEKILMRRFFDMLAKTPGKVAYGDAEVKKALDMGAVELILLSEISTDKTIMEFEELAQLTGAELKLISVETREGQQLRDLSGVAAILRFELE